MYACEFQYENNSKEKVKYIQASRDKSRDLNHFGLEVDSKRNQIRILDAGSKFSLWIESSSNFRIRMKNLGLILF